MIRIGGTTYYKPHRQTGERFEQIRVSDERNLNTCLNCPKPECKYGSCELIRRGRK